MSGQNGDNSPTNTRVRLFLVWGLLLLFLLLASALPQLTVPPRVAAVETSSRDPLLNLVRGMRLIVLVGMPLIVLFALLFLPVLRTRHTLMVLLVFLLIFGYVSIMARLSRQPIVYEQGITAVAPTAAEEIVGPTPTSMPVVEVEPTPLPTVPAWVEWLVSFVVVSSIVAFTAVLAWWFWPRGLEESPLPELAREAEQALQALQQGETLRNVVEHCYVEMGRVVDETQGVRRAQTATPREFEKQLAALGLPPEPVVGLTRLFERVRYGTAEPDAAAEREAVASLEAIARACREVA